MAIVTPLNQKAIMAGDTTDPANYINTIGKAALDGFKLFDDLLLVATYQMPERSAGGIFMPGKTTDESRFQGRCGLLLKRGPEAFKWDKTGQFAFAGDAPQDGEWLLFHYSDAREVFINQVSCRLISSRAVHGTVSDPRTIF
jgi:hypothetical protein